MLNIFSSTSGCRKFMALTAPFIQTAKETSAFMFVYSVMDRSCFEFVYRSHWALIKRIKNGQPFSAVLVGNPNTHHTHFAATRAMWTNMYTRHESGRCRLVKARRWLGR